MLREIHQQPAAIQTCLAAYWNAQLQELQLPPLVCRSSPQSPSRHSQPSIPDYPAFPTEVHIIASGTSRHASLIAQFWFEQLANLSTRVRSGSDFLTAPFPLIANTLTIGVTQSGETADTLKALMFDKQRRLAQSAEFYLHSMGITNQEISSLANHVDTLIPTLAGDEIGVAATKTFTTQLVVFYLLALQLAKQRQCIESDRCCQAVEALHQLPAKIQEVLQQTEAIQSVASRLLEAQNCILLGRGINHAIALEGALKLKETTYLHAEGYTAGEFMHGPIALLDEKVPVIAIVPADSTQTAMLTNVSKAKSYGSPVIGIVTNDNAHETAALFDAQIILPTVEEMLSPLLTVVPLQLLAYNIAIARGLNVDRPRNIKKTLA